MQEVNSLPSKHALMPPDGKQIVSTLTSRLTTHMKSEPLRRRDPLKPAPRLKKKQQRNVNPVDGSNDSTGADLNRTQGEMQSGAPPVTNDCGERRDKKQVGIVRPLLTLDKETHPWNCSELEKLQRRFSELLDGKSNEEKPLPTNENQLIERVESLYSSMGSLVYVSPCFARLFLLTDLQVCSLEQWRLIHCGLPVWLYNTGLNPRRSSELRLMLVDDKTGFILWSDQITAVSNVIQPTNLTLAFRHSLNNASIMLRFESNDERLFTRFYSYLKQNQFCTENVSHHKIVKRFIKKSDISPPCHFKHFNHVHEHVTDVHPLYY